MRPGAWWGTRLGVLKIAKPGVLDALPLDQQGGFATKALDTTRLDCMHFLWRESRSPEHALFPAPTPSLPSRALFLERR